MSGSWANSGAELLLDLRGSHRRADLEAVLRDAIRSGRLTVGTSLPSSRSLAAELGVARNTVADAYGQLVAEGWLASRQGSGTRVAERHVGAERPAARSSAATSGSRFNLTSGQPDVAGFPRAAWLSASRRALTHAPNELLGYPDPRGLLSLRESLTEYLARVRGVRTTPDHLMICSGFTQALNLLSVTLRRQGASTVSVESYGFDQHRDVVRAAGLATVPVTVDADGARTTELPDSEAVLLTPAHQFPLGVALTPERRSAALAWARAGGRLVIEDDYDGEFRYDRKPIGALQGLAPDSVAYVGTASKSLAPALGLAWMAVPPRLLDEVLFTKTNSDGYTGIFEQLALDEFIRSGAYERHVRRSRLRYRKRRDQLLERLSPLERPVRISGIAAGLHAVVELPHLPQSDEAAIRTRAARSGLAITPLSDFRYTPDPSARAGFVIGYGTPPDHDFAAAVEVFLGAIA
jgi:GntR family transcriptional regulator/MocR family aminotransferase